MDATTCPVATSQTFTTRSHPAEVSRLARAQERDLRGWLYGARTPDMTTMAAWVDEPNNDVLRQQYRDLQRRYQRLFLDYKRGQRDGDDANRVR